MTASGAGEIETSFAHATLCVGAVETAYRRVGSGAPVVLLGLSREDEAGLVGRLTEPSARRRVIVPDRTTLPALAPAEPCGESAFASWLAGFLHGLGLERPAVVAAPGFRQELERYRRLCPDDLGTVLMLGAGRSTDAIAVLLTS